MCSIIVVLRNPLDAYVELIWNTDNVSAWFILSWWCHMISLILANIDSDNPLSPVLCKAMTWNNADLLSFGLSRTNYCQILFEILTSSLRKVCLKCHTIFQISRLEWLSKFPGCLYNLRDIIRKFWYQRFTKVCSHYPDSKHCWAHVGPKWILPSPHWSNVGSKSLAIWVYITCIQLQQ